MRIKSQIVKVIIFFLKILLTRGGDCKLRTLNAFQWEYIEYFYREWRRNYLF